MSKPPRITAQEHYGWTERRVLCQPNPVYRSPEVEVRVDFDKGDHEYALGRLMEAVESVERQIAESHAPTWDGPGKVGEE